MKMNFEELEKYREKRGPLASKKGDEFGAFQIPYQSFTLMVLATNGEDVKPQWEHVSVSLRNRTPNWNEMCFIKDLFWGEDEAVVQYHPPKKAYINNHPHCLHMWKPVGKEIPLPPDILVGLKELNKED